MILASFPADDHLLCFAGIECSTPAVCPLFNFIQVTLEAFCAYDSIACLLKGGVKHLNNHSPNIITYHLQYISPLYDGRNATVIL